MVCSLGIFLILEMVVAAGGEFFSVQDITYVTKNVLDHYNLKCVYFLFNNSSQGLVREIMKIFSKSNIQAGSMYWELLSKNLQNRCLHVISVDQTLHKLSDSTLSKGKWLLFMDKKTSLREFFSGVYIPLDYEYLVARHTEMTIKSVFHVHPTRPLQMINVATWSATGGIVWNETSLRKHKSNLQGAILNVAIVTEAKFAVGESNEKLKPRKISRHLLDIQNEFQKWLNFTSEFVVAADGVLGTQKPDRTWTGIVGMLDTKQAEIGLDEFFYTDDRMEVIQYLPPIKNDKIMVFIKRPTIQDDAFTILSPFESNLWISIMASLGILVVALASICYILARYDKLNSDKYSFYNSLFYILGNFLQQGHENTPRTSCCRLVYLASYLIVGVVFVAYTATVISFLNVQKLYLPFTDFTSLLQDGSYQIRTMRGSARLAYFQLTPDPVLKNVYRSLMEPLLSSMPDHDSKGLNQLCSCPRCGYITPFRMPQILQKTYKCDVVGIPQAFYPITSSIIVSMNSPYRKIFGHLIHKMRRNGIIKRIYANTYPPMMNEILLDPPGSVTLGTALCIFVVLVSGQLLSSVILIIELLCKRFIKN